MITKEQKDSAIQTFKSFAALLAEFPESEWKLLEEKFIVKEYAPEEVVLNEGDDAQYAYFVSKGLVECYYLTDAGDEMVYRFSKKSDFAAPTIALLTDSKADCGIRAIEASILVGVDYIFWKKHLLDRHLCWDRAARRIFELEFSVRSLREKHFLILDTVKRYEFFKKNFPSFIDRIPQYKIASYLGVTPVTLSRAIQRIKP